MLRSGAARSLARSVASQTSTTKQSFGSTSAKLQLFSQSRALSYTKQRNLALALYKPALTPLRRYATNTKDGVDAKLEKQAAKEKLESHPEEVSIGSSVRQVFHEEGVQDPKKEDDMMAGIKADVRTIKETFTLSDTPKEALVFGLAGVLPYLGTSLSTCYLAWDINHAAHTGTGFLLDGKTAQVLLQAIEPIQIGYGAVIISFLGAIHWGLEWGKFGGTQGYSRYIPGVVAPAVAWPTIFMPVEYALITQFIAFNYLYFTDARAAAKGLAPSWYGTYRFVLTFIVGASIVASLIGRGQIVEMVGHPSSAADKIRALNASRDEYLAKENEEKEKNLAKEEEGEEEEEDDD